MNHIFKYSEFPEEPEFKIHSEKMLKNVEKIESLHLYISSYNDIKSLLKEDFFHREKTTKKEIMEMTNFEKYFKACYLKQELKSWFYFLQKKTVMFVANGGVGKTRQIIELYKSNDFYENRKMIIFGKFVEEIYNKTWFLDFILDEGNILLFDALNEGSSNIVEAIIEKAKCRIIATTRPTYQPMKTAIYLKNTLKAEEIIANIGMPEKLDPNLIPFLNILTPREFFQLLQFFHRKTKGESDQKRSPFSILRDTYEKYVKSVGKTEKIDSGKFWGFIKSKTNLMLDGEFEKENLLIAIKNSCPDDEEKIFGILEKYNFIQMKNTHYIYSNSNILDILRFTIEISKQKLGSYPSEKMKKSWYDIHSSFYVAELLFRKFKNQKTDVHDILKWLTPGMSNFEYTKHGQSDFYNNFEIEGSSWGERIKQKIHEIKIKKDNKKIIKFCNDSDGKLYAYDLINAISLVSSYIKINDKNSYMKSLVNIYGDCGRLDIFNLLKNFKIKRNQYFEFDRKSMMTDQLFEFLSLKEKILPQNYETLLNYITRGTNYVNLHSIEFLERATNMPKEKIIKKIANKTERYKTWYFLRVYFPEIKIKMNKTLKRKVGSSKNLFTINNKRKTNEDPKKIFEEYDNKKYINRPLHHYYNYAFIRSLSFYQSVKTEKYDFEEYIQENFKNDSDDFWIFVDKLHFLSKERDFPLPPVLEKRAVVSYNNLSKIKEDIKYDIGSKKINQDIFEAAYIVGDDEYTLKGTNDIERVSFFVSRENFIPNDFEDVAMTYYQYKNGFIKRCNNNFFEYLVLKKKQKQYLYNFKEEKWYALCERKNSKGYIEDYWGELNSKEIRHFTYKNKIL